MESTSTADLLASLELLDDVEGFDLFFSDVNSAVEPAYTTRDASLDQDSALMQQLELSGDLDSTLSKLIHTPSCSEEDTSNAAPSTVRAEIIAAPENSFSSAATCAFPTK
ncbi:hypothetical protein PR003_g34990 [Phytophthora rubi]|uniref:Uncharacterized protein n=1 Tax=Phytophthora rubi TaxID=129364 RepID=A0A6A4ANX1_9STRA|nr:hypothetical protein PR003_g34990 [Phytophthora rubi]